MPADFGFKPSTTLRKELRIFCCDGVILFIYFSAKDVANESTSRYGSVKKKAKGKKVTDLAKGCGSRGIIVFTKN